MNLRIFLILLSTISLFSCKTIRTPFSQSVPPPAPDYSKNASWLALPNRPDYADLTPDVTFQDHQSSAEVDVFYIHPTIYESNKYWNADVRDTALNHKTATLAVLNQATVFNGACKVYAPSYRQMTLAGFYTKDTASKWESLRFAYQDVKAAFQYYMEHYNNGRPFIIASHSQGTVHGVWLVRDMIAGKPIQDKLVAAYLIGFPYDISMLKPIPVCEDATQTGCFMNWNTYLDGKEPKDIGWYANSANVNPVSWKINGEASAAAHEGMVWKNFQWDKDRKLATRSHKNMIWVQNPIKLPLKKNFHVGDYNIFWVNIRKNVELRVGEYLKLKVK